MARRRRKCESVKAWISEQMEEGEAALLLVWKVWLCRVASVQKVI